MLPKPERGSSGSKLDESSAKAEPTELEAVVIKEEAGDAVNADVEAVVKDEAVPLNAGDAISRARALSPDMAPPTSPAPKGVAMTWLEDKEKESSTPAKLAAPAPAPA